MVPREKQEAELFYGEKKLLLKVNPECSNFRLVY